MRPYVAVVTSTRNATTRARQVASFERQTYPEDLRLMIVLDDRHASRPPDAASGNRVLWAENNVVYVVNISGPHLRTGEHQTHVG